jgi:hypothetical protein
MAENRKQAGSLAVVGYLAAAVLVVCLVVIGYHQINNVPFAKVDKILVALAVVAAIVGLWVFRAELGAALGQRGNQLNLNALVVTAAVFVIVTLLNYKVAPRFLGFVKKDLTAEKFYSLADQSINVVRNIKSKDGIEIIAVVPMSIFERQSPEQAHQLEVNQKRLKEYERLNPGAVHVEILDPNVSSKAKELLSKHVLSVVPGAVIRLKDKPDVREGVNSLDEAEITKGILKLLDTSSRTVYVLTGHGEVPLMGGGDTPGLGELKKMLENDRYEVKEHKFLGGAAIPTDAAALLAVAPKSPFLPQEREALTKYLQDGGRMLAILDPDSKSDLGDVLKPFGIEWHPEIVSDPEFRGTEDAQIFVSLDYGTHDAVALFKKTQMFSVFTRSGYFKHGTLPAEMDITDLVSSSKTSYATAADQTAAPDLKDPGKAPAAAPAQKVNGPFVLGITVASRAKADEAKDAKDAKDAAKSDSKGTRIAALGCADFVDGPYVGEGANLELAANLVAWLTDRTNVIGIRAKSPYEDEQKRKIQLDDAGRKRVLLLTFLLPLFLTAAAGIAVAVVRARR